MPVGTITALRAQANSSQRVNVFIDDEYAIGVSLTTLAYEQIFVGKLIDAETWARLESAERADKAVHAAARLIEARPRSIAEVRLRLRQKQFPPESIDHAIEHLSGLGLLDDAAFSRYWVDNRRSFSQRGSLALRDELRRKGVDRATIEEALASEEDPDTAYAEEQERARGVARAALRRYAGSADRYSFQRRLGAYLQRRGFTIDTIRPLLNELWAELRSADEPPDATG
jgi:regulatory protein